MHAWVLVWCGASSSFAAHGGVQGGGWIGLDPTNDMVASDQHVVLAVGRDYTDVAPMDGVIVSSGSQRIDVAVSVLPVAN
jgi:transglutaminase-like putative cysteine protease